MEQLQGKVLGGGLVAEGEERTIDARPCCCESAVKALNIGNYRDFNVFGTTNV